MLCPFSILHSPVQYYEWLFSVTSALISALFFFLLLTSFHKYLVGFVPPGQNIFMAQGGARLVVQ